MATVNVFTAARMLAIETLAIVSGVVEGDSLMLQRKNGETFYAGNVRGPQGLPGMNAVPTDAAVAGYVNGPASAVRTALMGLLNKKTRVVVGLPGDANSDYTSLSAALAAATSGTEILLRPGTHAITGNLVVPAGVSVRGLSAGHNDGAGAAIIAGSYSTSTSALTLQASSSVENLHFKNTHATGAAGAYPVAVDIRGAGVSVQNCTFTGPWGQGVLAYQVTDFRIINCTFQSIGYTVAGTAPGDAINLYGVDGGLVSGCLFRDCKQNAIYANFNSKNVTIIGNTVRGCPEGIQLRVGCSNITIVGNNFDIKGAATITSFGVIVQTNCVDTVIADNTFRTTAGTAVPFTAINVDDKCHRTIIKGNSIAAAGFGGGISVITTAGGSTNESVDCVITDNIIHNPSGYGIRVAQNADAAVVHGNRIVGGNNKGILVQCTRASVVGNIVTANSGFDGITIAGAYTTVSGNVVTNVGAGAGILVSGTDNTITGNMCTGNNTYGINDTGNTNVITGNNCGGNSHASADILSTGAASKVAYNIGRYTAKGAA